MSVFVFVHCIINIKKLYLIKSSDPKFGWTEKNPSDLENRVLKIYVNFN